MLELALTGFLLLQTASGSPNVLPPTGSTGGATGGTEEAQPTPPPTPTPRATPRGRRGGSPTPTPEPTPTPTPRPSNDLLVVVNKSDNSISVLDGSTGK